MLRRSKKKSAARLDSRRGVSAVEFAVVAPVMFLFVFGLIEVGRMMMVQQALTNAAREGSRNACLATTTSSSAVDTVVRDTLLSVLPNASNSSKVLVDTTPSALGGLGSGTPVTVNLQVRFSDVSWLPGNFLSFLGDPMLTAQSVHERE
jgi:Flp pilus assembly protein TadG